MIVLTAKNLMLFFVVPDVKRITWQEEDTIKRRKGAKMSKIIQTDKIIIQMNKITLTGIKSWVYQCNSIHSLQSLRAKINKRIKLIISPKEESPFANIPIEQKREILKDLFVDNAPLNELSKINKKGCEDEKGS